MRTNVRSLCMSVLITTLFVTPALGAGEEDELKVATEAMARYLCYEVFWRNGNLQYRTGIPLSVEVKIEGGTFHAWFHDAMSLAPKSSMFLSGSVRPPKVGVGRMRAYNEELADKLPEYSADRSHFIGGTISKTSFVIPPTCEPHYDAMAAQKELMLRTIVKTMQEYLGSRIRMKRWTGPRTVTLTIANFNTDYPGTDILVKPSGTLYTVDFHKPEDYTSDEYERNGWYPVRDLFPKSDYQDLEAKIKKYGISRRISIAP